ncbi:TPA: hypothetical protein QCR36_003966 [Bacillus cereus]|nr:hypothetical protein [Bacillus cereus]HDR4742435.1 hypothetical protein [Bacillus cereus]HDR4748022.1 hypothetical protein [Bacillus cereus]HDR4753496.1 hypothetical protein [Bacillus cereus]HDR4770705.1 hypothetical protein [Bacillus cereus]
MSYKGKGFEYFTHCGTKRFGTVKKIKFDKKLGIPIFIGVSPYGNKLVLTREEIHKFI